MGVPVAVHLVVLQHGLWGAPADMAYVDACLHHFADQRKVVVLNSDVNAARLTYDGIDVLGDRLANLVVSYCERMAAGGLRRVTRVSFIAYSLGGLITRYAIGKLAATGFFARPQQSGPPPGASPRAAGLSHASAQQQQQRRQQLCHSSPVSAAGLLAAQDTIQYYDRRQNSSSTNSDALGCLSPPTSPQRGSRASAVAYRGSRITGPLTSSQQPRQAMQQQMGRRCPAVVPVNFVTFASPHLGSWQPPTNLYRAAFNAVLPYTLSRTGSQLVLSDVFAEGLPLLAVMAHPGYAFHAGLAMFQKRIILANIRHDATVPFTTSCITMCNPYEEDAGQPINARYPCIVRPSTQPAQTPTLSGSPFAAASQAAPAPVQASPSAPQSAASGIQVAAAAAHVVPQMQQPLPAAQEGCRVRDAAAAAGTESVALCSLNLLPGTACMHEVAPLVRVQLAVVVPGTVRPQHQVAVAEDQLRREEGEGQHALVTVRLLTAGSFDAGHQQDKQPAHRHDSRTDRPHMCSTNTLDRQLLEQHTLKQQRPLQHQQLGVPLGMPVYELPAESSTGSSASSSSSSAACARMPPKPPRPMPPVQQQPLQPSASQPVTGAAAAPATGNDSAASTVIAGDAAGAKGVVLPITQAYCSTLGWLAGMTVPASTADGYTTGRMFTWLGRPWRRRQQQQQPMQLPAGTPAGSGASTNPQQLQQLQRGKEQQQQQGGSLPVCTDCHNGCAIDQGASEAASACSQDANSGACCASGEHGDAGTLPPASSSMQQPASSPPLPPRAGSCPGGNCQDTPPTPLTRLNGSDHPAVTHLDCTNLAPTIRSGTPCSDMPQPGPARSLPRRLLSWQPRLTRSQPQHNLASLSSSSSLASTTSLPPAPYPATTGGSRLVYRSSMPGSMPELANSHQQRGGASRDATASGMLRTALLRRTWSKHDGRRLSRAASAADGVCYSSDGGGGGKMTLFQQLSSTPAAPPSLHYSSSSGSLADACVRSASWDGSRGGNWQLALARNRSSSSLSGAVASPTIKEPEPPSGRLQGEVFVALLPLLVLLWGCMLLWLLALSAHHYALRVVGLQRDRSWPIAWPGGGGSMAATTITTLSHSLTSARFTASERRGSASGSNNSSGGTEHMRTNMCSMAVGGDGGAGRQPPSPPADVPLDVPVVRISRDPTQAATGTGSSPMCITLQADCRPTRLSPSHRAVPCTPGKEQPRAQHAQLQSAAATGLVGAMPTPADQGPLATTSATTPSVWKSWLSAGMPAGMWSPTSLVLAPVTMLQQWVYACVAALLHQAMTAWSKASHGCWGTLDDLWNELVTGELAGVMDAATAPASPKPSTACGSTCGSSRSSQQAVPGQSRREAWAARLVLATARGVLVADWNWLGARPQTTNTSSSSLLSFGWPWRERIAATPVAAGGDLPRGNRQSQRLKSPHSRPAAAAAAGQAAGTARGDQAAQQERMCDALNQLTWTKIAVNTCHYHAHACIVVRSSARYAASHGHIVEYALRQMRDLA